MAKPARLRDGCGRIVPPHLALPFRARERLLSAVDRFSNLVCSLRYWEEREGGECIETKAVEKHIDAIYRIAANGVPYVVCGCDNGCKTCNYKGWLSTKEMTEAGRSLLLDDS